MNEFEFKLDLLKQEMEFVQKNMIAYGKIQFIIKGWAITLFSALVFFAAKETHPIYLLFGAMAVLLFWLLDSYFKSIQLVYINRTLEIEEFLQKLEFPPGGYSFECFPVPATESVFDPYLISIGVRMKRVLLAGFKFQNALLYASMLAALAGFFVFEEYGQLCAFVVILIILTLLLTASSIKTPGVFTHNKTDHLVFFTNNHAPILTPKVAVRCEEIIRGVAKKLKIKVCKMAVSLDHVHIFYKYPPTRSPNKITRQFKERSSYQLRKEFSELEKEIEDKLWTPSDYHSSVWQGFEVVESYIKSQDDHHRR